MLILFQILICDIQKSSSHTITSPFIAWRSRAAGDQVTPPINGEEKESYNVNRWEGLGEDNDSKRKGIKTQRIH